MNTPEQLLEDLLKISTELEHLSHVYADFYKNYMGQAFAEQSVLAGEKLDNLILRATHETASEIDFCRQSIVNLSQFIEFRKTHHVFDDVELSLIIDKTDLSALEKAGLQKKYNTSIDIMSIKRQWNQLFINKNYKQVKTSLKI